MLTKVKTSLDEETIKIATAYGTAAGHASMSETYRELILEGLRHKTEGVHASIVRQQVKEELDALMSRLEIRLELMAADTLATMDDRLSAQAEATSMASMATLRIASELAAVQPGEQRDAEEIRDDAIGGLWEVASRLRLGGIL